MVLQASFSDPVTRKAKEWSPIDRMLANKRLSANKASPGRKSNQTLMETLPRLSQLSEAPAPRTTSVGCQSMGWQVLLSEAIAPERARVKVLEAELKDLRIQHSKLLKDREELSNSALLKDTEEASALQEAEKARAALTAELEALRQTHAAAVASHLAERQQFQEERDRWQEERAGLVREVASAGQAEKRCVEDLERLRSELRCCQEDSAALRRKYAALQEESSALAAERDHLLHRLETEQAEMIARVDVLQKRMSEGSGKVRTLR